jgi:predicted NodU family carbamoyl transferase
MYILGVNHGWHDSSAAILHDGSLVALVESDRVSRIKNAMGEKPTAAIIACLSEAGVTLDDIEAIAIGWDEPVCAAQKGEVHDPAQFREWLIPRDLLPRDREPPIQFVPHHLAHAASGMWTSGFDDAAVLVVDGRGETQSTSLAVGTRDTIRWFAEWDIAHSLGNFYGYAAEWAGFGFWGPGKLMGLAPYGKPLDSSCLVPTDSGYRFKGNGRSPTEVHEQESAHRALLDTFFESLYPFAPGDVDDIMAHAGFAASVQVALEEAVIQLARIAKERSGSENLVITGGVGLNCTLNGRLARSGLFREIYVPPVTFDTGVGLGAALIADRQRCPDREPMPRFQHAYWGATPSAEAVEADIQASGLLAERLPEEELVSRVADRIADGKVVGWFQGRAEIGQRALGARSMLCDPRDRRRLVRVNTVKGREVWRPLAPSVLDEYADQLFEGRLPGLSDFMLAALPVRHDAWRTIPATVHVDGSARPQRVRRDTNSRYWRLIDTFRERTGVPAVMNTSFNLAGEPIVHSAADAISSFNRSEMDVLAIENFFIEKAAP